MDISQFLQVYLFAEIKLWTTFKKYTRSLLHKLQNKYLVITTDESNEAILTLLIIFFSVNVNCTKTVVEKLRAQTNREG